MTKPKLLAGSSVQCIEDYRMTSDNSVAFSKGNNYYIDEVIEMAEVESASAKESDPVYMLLDDAGSSHGMEHEDLMKYFVWA